MCVCTLQNLCCLSVVKDFHKLCKYNINTLTEPVVAPTVQETEPEAVLTEQSEATATEKSETTPTEQSETTPTEQSEATPIEQSEATPTEQSSSAELSTTESAADSIKSTTQISDDKHSAGTVIQ